VTDVLSGRYKENDLIIKSSIKIDKNVKLVTDVLSGRYKENDLIIKSSIKIDKNVKL